MSNHAITIDEDHFQQWLHIMRTTSAPQVKGKLCAPPRDEPEVKGFCCLGLGSTLVEGVTIERATLLYPDHENEVPDDYYYVFSADDLAPHEFVEWLTGQYESWHGDSHDVVPDFPQDLKTQGPKAHGKDEPALYHQQSLTVAASAANMNDSGMSFSQIADTFAYFGVGAIRS